MHSSPFTACVSQAPPLHLAARLSVYIFTSIACDDDDGRFSIPTLQDQTDTPPFFSRHRKGANSLTSQVHCRVSRRPQGDTSTVAHLLAGDSVKVRGPDCLMLFPQTITSHRLNYLGLACVIAVQLQSQFQA